MDRDIYSFQNQFKFEKSNTNDFDDDNFDPFPEDEAFDSDHFFEQPNNLKPRTATPIINNFHSFHSENSRRLEDDPFFGKVPEEFQSSNFKYFDSNEFRKSNQNFKNPTEDDVNHANTNDKNKNFGQFSNFSEFSHNLVVEPPPPPPPQSVKSMRQKFEQFNMKNNVAPSPPPPPPPPPPAPALKMNKFEHFQTKTLEATNVDKHSSSFDIQKQNSLQSDKTNLITNNHEHHSSKLAHHFEDDVSEVTFESIKQAKKSEESNHFVDDDVEESNHFVSKFEKSHDLVDEHSDNLNVGNDGEEEETEYTEHSQQLDANYLLKSNGLEMKAQRLEIKTNVSEYSDTKSETQKIFEMRQKYSNYSMSSNALARNEANNLGNSIRNRQMTHTKENIQNKHKKSSKNSNVNRKIAVNTTRKVENTTPKFLQNSKLTRKSHNRVELNLSNSYSSANIDYSNITDPIALAGVRLLSVAAIPIQCLARKYLAKNAACKRFNAILTLQSTARMFLAKLILWDARYAATLIQSAWRGYDSYLTYSEYQWATVCIQRYVRGYVYKKRYEDIVAKIVKCQSVVRSFLAFNDVVEKLVAVMKIQSAWRMYVAKCDYEYRQECVVKIQAATRGFLGYLNYLEILSDVILCQCVVRGYLAKCKLKKLQEQKRELAAVTLQREWRRYYTQTNFIIEMGDILLVQKVCRAWLARRAAAIKIQKTWRKFWCFSNFLILKFEICKLQGLVRGWLCRQELLFEQECAVIIQSSIRKYLAVKKLEEVKCYALLINSSQQALIARNGVLKIQRLFRNFKRKEKEKEDLARRKQAALVIERFFLFVKKEVDAEVQRVMKLKKIKREKRLMKQKLKEDKMLERLLKKTVPRNVDHKNLAQAELAVKKELGYVGLDNVPRPNNVPLYQTHPRVQNVSQIPQQAHGGPMQPMQRPVSGMNVAPNQQIPRGMNSGPRGGVNTMPRQTIPAPQQMLSSRGMGLSTNAKLNQPPFPQQDLRRKPFPLPHQRSN